MISDFSDDVDKSQQDKPESIFHDKVVDESQDDIWIELISWINHFLTGKDYISELLLERLKSKFHITRKL